MAEEKKCYFSIPRYSTIEDEEKGRTAESSVSTNCGGNSTSFKSLFTKKESYSDKSIAEIILARGAALFDINENEYDNEIICDKHQNELYTKWDIQANKHIILRKVKTNEPRKPVCSFPEGYSINHGSTRPIATGSIVNYNNAKNFLNKEKLLLHVGLPICHEHKKYLESLQTSNETKKEQTEASSSSSTVTIESQSSDYKPPREFRKKLEKPEPIVSDEVYNAFLNFARVAGFERLEPHNFYSRLADETQRKKGDIIKKLTRVIAEVMAPDDPESLLQQLSNNSKKESKVTNQIDKLLCQIVDNYLTASNDRERNEILSQVAYAFPLNTLLEYFPYLSRNRYSRARKTALMRTLVSKPITSAHIKVRYSKPIINLFIEFITSDLVMVGLPFGTQKIKFSSGLKDEIPNTIRRHRANEICSMFVRFLKETGREDIKLSVSTMKNLLKICTASKRVATQCVDYYVAEGSEAYEAIYNTLEKSFEIDLISEPKKKEIHKLFQESHHYLKTDYRMNVKMNSRCPSHCITYALSDPTNKNFSSIPCEELKENSHKHDLQCERCMYFHEAIRQIQNILNEKLNETKEEDELFDKLCELKEIIENAITKIENYKKHLLRSVFSDMQRAAMIAKLIDGEAFVTMDYAQKWIPRKSAQQQREYYAQKGLSWHICHIFAMINGILKQHSITHLMGYEKQSAKTVTTITRDVVSKLKSWNINRVSFRSDNASNYRNVELMVNLFAISMQEKIRVDRYSLSEVQNGKSSGDTECARLKRRMRDYLDAGYDVETPLAMFRAIHYGTIPLCAMTVAIADVKGKDFTTKKPLNGISKISDFVFDYEKRKIRYWQYYGIGKGETINIDDYKTLVLNAELKISKQSEHTPNSPDYIFWRPSHVATNEIKKENIQDAVNETDEEFEIDPEDDAPIQRDEAIFFCPINGCQKSYEYYGYLQRHITMGKHQFVPDRCTLRDYALKTYARNLEGAGAGKILPELSEMLENLAECEEVFLQKGWAIRERAPRINYSIDMKKFLDEEFESSQRLKQRINPKTVQEKMANEKKYGKIRFKVKERLSSIQIGRYFASKLNKLREGESAEEDDSENYEDDLLHDEPMFCDKFEALLEEVEDWSTIIPPGKEEGEWSEEETEEEITPKKKTPKKSTPKKATPKKATPKKATPKKATPKKATPKKSATKNSEPNEKDSHTQTPSRRAKGSTFASSKRNAEPENENTQPSKKSKK